MKHRGKSSKLKYERALIDGLRPLLEAACLPPGVDHYPSERNAQLRSKTRRHSSCPMQCRIWLRLVFVDADVILHRNVHRGNCQHFLRPVVGGRRSPLRPTILRDVLRAGSRASWCAPWATSSLGSPAMIEQVRSQSSVAGSFHVSTAGKKRKGNHLASRLYKESFRRVLCSKIVGSYIAALRRSLDGIVISWPGVKLAVHNDPRYRTTPTVRETEVAVVADAALSVAEGDTVQVFTNDDAKRQLNVQPEFVLCRVNFGVLEFQPEVQKAPTGLPVESLTHHGRACRLHTTNAHIKEISPSGGLREEHPHDVDGGIDHSSGTARVSHRVFSIRNTCVIEDLKASERCSYQLGHDQLRVRSTARFPLAFLYDLRVHGGLVHQSNLRLGKGAGISFRLFFQGVMIAGTLIKRAFK